MIVDESEFAAIVQERDRLRLRVTELLEAMNREVERRREAERNNVDYEPLVQFPGPTLDMRFAVGKHPELEKLLEHALAHGPMTKANLWDQRVSWVYGNLPYDSPLTREDIEARMEKMYGPRPTN